MQALLRFKKPLEIFKSLLISLILLYFITLFFPGAKMSHLNGALYAIMALSAINIIIQIGLNVTVKEKDLPVSAIANLAWFSFLRFTFLHQTLVHQDDTGTGFHILLIILSLGFLLFYLIKTLRRVFHVEGQIKLKPYRLIAVSFLTVIFMGSILLFLPISRQAGQPPLSLLDAFFTATSAVCVTGLIVVDTGSYFSLFGQIVILLMIQVGALGIMTFAGFFSVIMGEKLSLFDRYTAQNAVNEMHSSGMNRFLISVVLTTVIIELSGSFFLWLRFKDILPWDQALYYSVFHAISAFCNAGFSLYSDSLMQFREDTWMNLVFMLLITLGGLGFAVIVNLRRLISGRERRLSLHSKLVLFSSAVLIILGATLFFILEYANILNGMKGGEKILTSLFSSVTTRTAGFNTIDYSQARPATLFMSSIMMFIGASPGSTGGGIKTTTIMIMIMTIYHTLKERSTIRVFGRDLHIETVRKALVLFFLSLAWVFLISIILSSLEDQAFINIMFECLSAFGTVGLSTGITPSLSPVSKSVIIITMFLGRLGPLTLMYSLGMQTRQFQFGRPVEKVQVG